MPSTFSAGRPRIRKQSKGILLDENYGQTANTYAANQQQTSSFASQQQQGQNVSYQTQTGGAYVQPSDVIRGDESLPWRRAKPKLRSRSLQPGERNIEDFPWLRQRDRSLPRQEQILWGRDKVPIKPWIEEVICLKRTEIRRKLVERGCELEKVLLKASQIERREIIRAQIVEHIDLKSVQKYFERGNYATMAEAQMAMTEEILQEYEDTTHLQQQKHEEDMSILELTKEIDALVKKDYDIPWSQQGQVTTVEKSKRTSRKSSRDQRSTVLQQDVQQMQRIQATEETTILRLDKHDELNVQLIQQQQIGVPWARGIRHQQQQLSQQSQSHIEDSNVMSVNRHQMDEIQQQQQEVAVGWRRGRQPQQSVQSQQQLQHTEDSTMLSINRNDYIEQSQIEQMQMNEQPVAWRRGPKPQPQQSQQLQHTEDSTMLSVNQVDRSQIEQVQMNEQPVAWRRGPKPQPQQPQQKLQHLEDSNMLDVQRLQSEELQEVAVAWKRGGRKPVTAPVQQHVEDVAIMQVEQSQVDEVPLQQEEEVAVPWARGQKKPKPVEPQLQEVAVPWARGKKKQQPVVEPEPEPEPLVEEKKPIKKKKTKPKKPTSAQTSPDAEEFVDQIPDFEADEQQPDETTVADEITEVGETEEPQKQFILREVQEVEEIVEKKKVKVRRPRKPSEEVAEELAAPEEPEFEQIEPVETEQVQEMATVEQQVQVQKKLIKKKKPKVVKQVVFNDEIEVETIEDEAAEVTQSSIQLRQAQVKPTVVQTEETSVEHVEQTEEEFRKDIDVKMVSNIVKKDKRRLHIDDSQPLPELELITQKRVQQGIDMVADEEIIEDIVKDSIKESLSNTSLPERLLVKKKPVVMKAPRFLKKLQPAVCQPDQPTVLQCKIDGNPYPDVKWFFNDIELFASEKYIFNVTEKVATLEIVRVTPLDVGVYTCQARNQAGVATSRSNIVLGKFMFWLFFSAFFFFLIQTFIAYTNFYVYIIQLTAIKKSSRKKSVFFFIFECQIILRFLFLFIFKW